MKKNSYTIVKIALQILYYNCTIINKLDNKLKLALNKSYLKNFPVVIKIRVKRQFPSGNYDEKGKEGKVLHDLISKIWKEMLLKTIN